ncbi:MAG: hypothetical protein ACYDG4_15320 [Desulfuromonadaceae bacterium]
MRKPHIIIVAILVAAAIASAGCNNNQAKVLSVKDVESSQLPSKEPVTIIGIVASVSNNPKEFTLMDVSDAQSNKPVRDTFYLRVISTGRAPKAGEVVKVTGQLVEHGLYFAATKVKRWKLGPA